MSTVARMHVGLHVLWGLLLVLATVRAVWLGASPWLVVPAALAEGAWYAAGHRLARPRSAGQRLPNERHGTGTSSARWWLAGLVVGWVLLVSLVSVEFSWLVYPLILIAVAMLPTLAAHPLAAAMTLLVVVLQLGSRQQATAGLVIGPVVGALVAIGTAATYQRLVRESEERRRLVEQLLATQEDLVAVHDELAATQREAGVVAERARLARDIHDTLAQGFSSVVLLARAGQADPTSAARMLDQIESTAADNLDEARRVVQALTPAPLETAPLPGALGRLLDRLGAQTGMSTSLDVDGEARQVPTTVEVALLRVAQSALANVRQHSGAQRVGLTLTYDDDAVTLDVLDDGRGFDRARVEATPVGLTGFGLRAMRERLAVLGGRLEVETAPGEGTAVVATIPLTGQGAGGAA